MVVLMQLGEAYKAFAEGAVTENKVEVQRRDSCPG